MPEAAQVSVALCTRNGSRFIAEQIQSILGQTILPQEIVISDDASTDDTVAIVTRAFTDRPDLPLRLRVFRNAVALGVTANFEQAIRACTGDIVILSDQDDIWAPNRVERMIEEFSRDPDILLIHSDARLVGADRSPLGRTLFEAYDVDVAARAGIGSGHAFELFLRRNLVTGATAAIRSDLAKLAVPFPASWVHDEWLAIIAAASGRIHPLAERLIDYRQHDNNQIGAADLGLRAKLRRLTAPGAERNSKLLQRAADLAERYPALPGATAERILAVERKLAHERVRSALNVRRFARIRAVAGEARTGRYGEFGGGVQDIVRDLVQPLKTGR